MRSKKRAASKRVAEKHVLSKQNGEAKAEPGVTVHPTKILSIDIGGSKVKMLVGGENEPRKLPSGPKMTPLRMVEAVLEAAQDWEFDAVSIGYPGLVGPMGPRSEPGNLGPGWVGFNFGAAFRLPVRIINDASMQALGSYEGGRMLFLGLGTGLGSTLIADNVIVPLELGRLRDERTHTFGEVLGRAGLKKLGKSAWYGIIEELVSALTTAFVVDYIVLGGGNAKVIKEMPPGTRRGHNLTAFRGGLRLWNLDNVPTLSSEGAQVQPCLAPGDWRVI